MVRATKYDTLLSYTYAIMKLVMKMQIGRLFEIVYILLDKKTTTAKDLAQHFEVSQRTIYRDIDTLTAAGIPIYTNKGKGGGISLLDNFVLNKSLLSENEQDEILTALHSLSLAKDPDASNVLSKLSTMFNKSAVDWIQVDFSDWRSQDSTTFSSIKSAILNKHAIQFDYYSSFGEKSERRIEPLQLSFKHRAWYVVGYCTAKKDIRVFKLFRIKNLVVTNESFDRTYHPQSINQPYDPKLSKLITVKLRIDASQAYRVYDDFDESQVEKCSDDSFIVTSTYPEDQWVYGNILSFGHYAEVLEPDYLREVIKERLKKSLDKYL